MFPGSKTRSIRYMEVHKFEIITEYFIIGIVCSLFPSELIAISYPPQKRFTTNTVIYHKWFTDFHLYLHCLK